MNRWSSGSPALLYRFTMLHVWWFMVERGRTPSNNKRQRAEGGSLKLRGTSVRRQSPRTTPLSLVLALKLYKRHRLISVVPKTFKRCSWTHIHLHNALMTIAALPLGGLSSLFGVAWASFVRWFLVFSKVCNVSLRGDKRTFSSAHLKQKMSERYQSRLLNSQ